MRDSGRLYGPRQRLKLKLKLKLKPHKVLLLRGIQRIVNFTIPSIGADRSDSPPKVWVAYSRFSLLQSGSDGVSVHGGKSPLIQP
jgi:hypothetical protein